MNRKNRRLAGKLNKVAGRPAAEPAPEEMAQVVGLMRSGRYDIAEGLARNLVERFPRYGFAWKILGIALLLQGRGAEALAPLQTAAPLLPADADIPTNIGIILDGSGRLSEAEAAYTRALQIRADHAIARNNLGNTLRKLGRLPEAEASFRAALGAKPDFAEAAVSLGHTLVSAGRLEEAEAAYRRALELRPELAEVHADLGETLKKLGKEEEALEQFRAALASRGDWREALRRLTEPLVVTEGLVVGAPSAPQPLQQRIPAEASPSPAGDRKLRVVLIYPPPWQIAGPGQPPQVGMPFGLPADVSAREVDGDFQTITYGLLTIAAQVKRAGHEVRVYNLSATPWEEVVEALGAEEADLFGISAFTANRRGMAAVTALLRERHPHAHIAVGGPFVTALPAETLSYGGEIDTAVIGEGEATFLELIESIASGRSTAGIPGTAWREGEEVRFAPPRPRIDDLDALASPFEYFTSPIVMTSRGCPGKCSFCGSFTTWGRKVRFHSVEATLEIFCKALDRLPVPVLSVKDDTFTAHRQRALAICDAIVARGMNFLWSCDTRVDCIDDELLRRMRLAGCQMISLGVESGSPEILKEMCKETSPEMVLQVTRAARKYGMHVRYYMILANRGETPETLGTSIELIREGRPTSYYFSPLGFNPGTRDWDIVCRQQGLTADIFFRNDFRELGVKTRRHEDVQHLWLQTQCDIGTVSGFDYTVEERRAAAELLPQTPTLQVELANACLRSRLLEEAEAALRRAEELGFPVPNIVANQRACIAAARGDAAQALALLESAAAAAPDRIVMGNRLKLQRWLETPVERCGRMPKLADSVLVIDFTVDALPGGVRPL